MPHKGKGNIPVKRRIRSAIVRKIPPPFPRPNQKGANNMRGLRIRTPTGQEFEVIGAVTFKDFSGDGRIYYCDGQSWPAEIVREVLQ